MEPEDSLITGDENLSTIPKKESDEFIKSSVEGPFVQSKVSTWIHKVLEDIESEDSYVFKLDEPDLLVAHLSKLNEDECIVDDDFDPKGISYTREVIIDNHIIPLPL
ncbi:hypothetical protein Tco_0454020 [Tanacetum coccineum]